MGDRDSRGPEEPAGELPGIPSARPLTGDGGGPLRVLLVGFGEMVRCFHVPTLQATPGVELVGVVRSRPAEAVAGVPVFTSLEEALGRLRPGLAVVSTPHHLHAPQAGLCLEHGCHVLVEKPLSLEVEAAERLVDLAAERGLLLVEGLQRRYEGFAQVFRELAASGELGELRLLHGLFAHRFGEADRAGWRSDPRQAGDGILGDSAIHLIDLLVSFAGPGTHRLRSRVLSDGGQGPSHSFLCFFDTDRGATVSACGSYLSPSDSVQEEISVWGSRGSLFARRFCPERTLDPPTVVFKDVDGVNLRELDLSSRPFGRGLPLAALLSVLTGRAPREALLSEARLTLPTHRALDAIRRNALEG
ncbi:MAG: Gfo/Idh/MocA family oxidoreductase [Acidobacteriota bacterium]